MPTLARNRDFSLVKTASQPPGKLCAALRLGESLLLILISPARWTIDIRFLRRSGLSGSFSTRCSPGDGISFRVLLAAELLNPTKQCLIEGRFHGQEFDTHANTRFENPNNRQGFDDLILARQSCANPASNFKSFARADKCAGDGKIGGYST